MSEATKQFIGKIPEKLLTEIEETVPASKTRKVAEMVLEEYERIKVDPGESVGLVSAQSIGEPGTQMSISKDEKVIVKIKDKIRIVKIGDFIDGVIELKGSLRVSAHSEVTPLNDLEVLVPSINNDEHVEWKKVIECSRHKPTKKLIKITTASGREITSTDNHSFVTRKNNLVIPIKGNDLRIGDRIPIINNFFTQNNVEKIKINDYVTDDSISIEDDDFLTKRATKPVRNTIQLNSTSGWFVGAYLSEGYADTGCVGISNINDIFIQNAKNFVESTGLNFVDNTRDGSFGPSRTLTVRSSILGNFVVNSCGRLSRFKIVPEFAFSASDEFIAGLLRGYFDGDGNFHVDRKMIRASSNSKELIDGIALLLSRFKIFSNKIKDKKGQHWILIPYKYAPTFLAKIGSDIDYKLCALKKLSEDAKKFWNDKSQDYTDMIPGFGNILYDTAKKLGVPTRLVNNFTKRQKIGRTALYRYTKIFEYAANKKGINISEELKILNKMFNSDVIWDEIVSVKIVENYENFVYDFSVPGLETFTTFDGIITHNTLNTFHFAGVAEMNVTMGLPRLIEILDARKEPSTPMMEIYLKSPHNKGKDIKKLALSLKSTTLGDLSREFSINLVDLAIEIVLHEGTLEDHGLTMDSILKLFAKSGKFSKEFTIKKTGNNSFTVKAKGSEASLNDLYKLKEALKSVVVGGMKGIRQVLPVKRGEEFLIITAGSSLKKVLSLDFVDAKRTTTNNIVEIREVLGVEAAREVVILEVLKVLEAQGLDIDIRHVLLVADTMCTSGFVKGVTRYGVVSEKSSVLARASFETPLRHVMNAALTGEIDELDSVVENVMLNQAIPVGTGLPGLVTKVKKDGEK